MSPGPDPMETPEMSTEGLSRTVRLRACALPAGLPPPGPGLPYTWDWAGTRSRVGATGGGAGREGESESSGVGGRPPQKQPDASTGEGV